AGDLRMPDATMSRIARAVARKTGSYRGGRHADVVGAGLAGDLRMPDAAVSRTARAVARKTGSYKGGRHADVVGAGLAGDLRMPDAAVSRTARAVARKTGSYTAAMPLWRSSGSRLGARPRKAVKFSSALRLPPRERISRRKRAPVSASCSGASSNAA